MNTDELRRLAARAEGVEGRQADRLNELHARIRTARRRRAGVGAAAAAAVVVALVVGSAVLTATSDRTQEPVDRRAPRPTPTERVDVPAGQRTVFPDIGPGDIGGWELKASRANTEPAFANAADLSLTVGTPGLLDFGGLSQLASFCHGEPDTWWVLTIDLGAGEGGPQGRFGRCSQGDPATVPPPTGPIDPGRRDEGTTALPVRMFVTGPLPAAAQRCLGTEHAASCPASHGLVPFAETDAAFGFGVYEPGRATTVMDIPGLARLEAVGIADGVEYLVDRAVLPADGAPRLVVRLPASDRRRMIGLLRGGDTSALEDCVARLGHGEPSDANEEMAQYEEVDRKCLTDLELRVDGERPPTQDSSDSSFAEATLPPGDAHDVTVEVARNDPRNVRYALVVWEER